MGIYTIFLVPETKGVPIEEIEYKFRSHRLWGKVMAKHDAREEAKTIDDIKEGLGGEGVHKVGVADGMEKPKAASKVAL